MIQYWGEPYKGSEDEADDMIRAERERERALPKNTRFPPDAVQCDECGGYGCDTCGQNGWLPSGHAKGRKCEREECQKPIPPAHLAVYCSDECARKDA